MATARVAEYTAVTAEARAAASAGAREARRTGERLRAELRRIGRRDYFPPPERDIAYAAVRALLDLAGADSDGTDRDGADSGGDTSDDVEELRS
jgi:hypothetical protein